MWENIRQRRSDIKIIIPPSPSHPSSHFFLSLYLHSSILNFLSSFYSPFIPPFCLKWFLTYVYLFVSQLSRHSTHTYGRRSVIISLLHLNYYYLSFELIGVFKGIRRLFPASSICQRVLTQLILSSLSFDRVLVPSLLVRLLSGPLCRPTTLTKGQEGWVGRQTPHLYRAFIRQPV